MTDDAVTVASALGTATLPWSAFERIWHDEHVVLLFHHGWQYLAFPAPATPREALDFATAKIA